VSARVKTVVTGWRNPLKKLAPRGIEHLCGYFNPLL
jgi:hypothetical protein